MKNLKLFFLGALVTTTVAAQDKTITATNPISKEQTPDKVIKALEAAFPDAKSVQYFKVTPEMIAKGWTVTEEDNMNPGESIEHYTISFKRGNVKYYGLFDAEGNLQMSKWEEKEVALPEPVKASLKHLAATDYKGYKMQSKTYYKTKNYDKSKEYYEIVATKGKDKKTVIVAPDGTVVKIKG